MTLSRTAIAALAAALTLTGSAYAIGSYSQGKADLDVQSASLLSKSFKSFKIDDNWQNEHQALANYLATFPARRTRTAFADSPGGLWCASCHPEGIGEP
ncbi:MAG: hypothetical protein J2P54_08235 [Bradyrhizobiaceae bacterium]|nr:hypothetical protein [Bradyrhizobiaceae bacterium]